MVRWMEMQVVYVVVLEVEMVLVGGVMVMSVVYVVVLEVEMVSVGGADRDRDMMDFGVCGDIIVAKLIDMVVLVGVDMEVYAVVMVVVVVAVVAVVLAVPHVSPSMPLRQLYETKTAIL